MHQTQNFSSVSIVTHTSFDRDISKHTAEKVLGTYYMYRKSVMVREATWQNLKSHEKSSRYEFLTDKLSAFFLERCFSLNNSKIK